MRVLFSGITFLFLWNLLNLQVAVSQWAQTAGPYGGQVNTFLIKDTRLFVGSEGGGIFSSTNTGRSWIRSDPGILIKALSSLCEHDGSILAATDLGILRSDDDGTTWRLANGSMPDTMVTFVEYSGGYLLANFPGRGLFRSGDEGLSWQMVYSPDKQIEEELRAIFVTDSLVLVGGSKGCLASTDNGLTWSLRNSGMTVRPVVSFAKKDTLVFAGTTGSIFRSSDMGGNWEEVEIGSIRGVGAWALVVSGENLFAGNEEGVFQSVNNGDLWLPVNAGLEGASVKALAVQGPALIAGTDAGVFRTTDNGAGWLKSNDGLTSTRVRTMIQNGPYVFAGTRGSGVYRTLDGGQTWELANEGLTNKRVSNLVNSGEYILAGTSGSGVFRSDNLGASWVLPTQNVSDTLVHTLLVSGTYLYAGTEHGLCSSNDDGDTWTCGGLDSSTIRSLAVSGSFLFAGSVNDGMFRSSNNGLTWEKLDAGNTTDTTISALAVSGQYIFAGTGSRGMFRSADNGDTWNAINVNMPDSNITSILVSDDRIYIATFGEGAFTSTNNGDSWELWNDNLQGKELLSLLLAGTTIYGGTSGWGVETRQIPPSAPGLSAPPDNAEAIPVPAELTWAAVPGATSYDVQLCLNDVFDSLAVDTGAVAATRLDVQNIARNTRYYWRARANGPGGKGLFSAPRAFTTVATTVFVNEPIHQFPQTPLSSTDYRLIGIPGDPDRPFSSVFTGEQGVDWNVYVDNGTEPPNHLAAVHPDSFFQPGKGYWAIAKGLLNFSGTVTMPELDTGGNYAVSLVAGWNIITNPFDQPVSADAIRGLNGDPSLGFWLYLGIDQYETVETLLPFSGYYVKNLAGLSALSFPFPFPARPAAMPQKPGISWQLRIVLVTSEGNDRQNYIGIAPEALQGRDAMDIQKPAGPGAAPYLTFVHEAGPIEVLGSDFRPELGEGQVWLFDVKNPGDGKAALSFPRESTLPKGLSVLLVDTESNERTNVLSDSLYEYASARPVTRFMLLVGPGDFGNNYLDSTIPDEFMLSHNYPNPFNPETAMNVSIPVESDVRLVIFSLLGEEVTLLVSGRLGAGRYAYVWDGKDLYGRPVSSGVYLARLEVGGTPMFIRKMLLLR